MRYSGFIIMPSSNLFYSRTTQSWNYLSGKIRYTGKSWWRRSKADDPLRFKFWVFVMTQELNLLTWWVSLTMSSGKFARTVFEFTTVAWVYNPDSSRIVSINNTPLSSPKVWNSLLWLYTLYFHSEERLLIMDSDIIALSYPSRDGISTYVPT